ncbi:hypothetical protein NIES4075_68270 [Tolypothrix sp. NIES-4075]|uniref:hypothetical protein n=1 Tax=Tolypothrix sp. NIES-4075 TaxID=2005459 RepID=UPI000B5C9708|nr:hypothetical protein [Tolypothrix sp. NIES-4075]GAX45806.1 hypothetical protein NIES4075_68270 [Tolypothrix sp. NIES-4075]
MVCTLQKSVDRELRQFYEAFMGDRVADTTWRTIKRFITETGLELNSNNLHEYALLRKRYPKLSLTPLEFRTFLVAVDKARNSLPQLINGEEFIRLLIAQEIRPDISTIYRWFKQSGSKYNKLSCYSTEVMFGVIYRAVVWKFIETRRNRKNG